MGRSVRRMRANKEQYLVMPPAFMFGFERSGTTLLSMIVGSHPEIAVPYSVSGMWYEFAERLGEFGALARQEDLEALVDDVLDHKRVQSLDLVPDRETLLDGLPLRNYPALVRRFHEAYAHATGQPNWANLDIQTIRKMHTANRWFSDARFVHIVRDGRDVALSFESYKHGTRNTLDCATRWRDWVGTNLRMGSMLPRDRYLVIRYEDLLAEPESTCRVLCGFLGVAYCPQMLEYGTAVERKIPSERRSLWPLIEGALQPQNAYRWKREMPAARRGVFERRAGTVLRELGYAIESEPPRRLDASILEVAQFLDSGQRLRRLARRLGRRRS